MAGRRRAEALENGRRGPVRKAVTKATYEALAEFRYSLRQFLAFSEQQASSAGLTPQQHQALLAIKGSTANEWLSIGEVAERLLIRHHSAVELINRLEELQLVSRRIDPEDGRRIQVWISKKGDAALEVLSAIHVAELENIGPTLRRLMRQFDRATKKGS